jgi:hypothetical protein
VVFEAGHGWRGRSERGLSMKCLKIVALVALLSMCLSVAALAATLRGKVLCENGASIQKSVSIAIRGHGTDLTLSTDDRGNYAVVIPAGTYRFVIENKRFEVFVYEENAPKYFYIPCP